jgi:hypothetical protein
MPIGEDTTMVTDDAVQELLDSIKEVESQEDVKAVFQQWCVDHDISGLDDLSADQRQRVFDAHTEWHAHKVFTASFTRLPR